MKPQKKIISRLLPFEEDYTYIEIQIVIVDKNSQELLCKLSHGKRSENFKDAVEGMMANVETFFLRDVVRKIAITVPGSWFCSGYAYLSGNKKTSFT